MRPHIKDIVMVWRQGKSHERIPVAVIEYRGERTIFRYIPDGVKKAREQGFAGFPDFSENKEIHETNVLRVLSQRINDSGRTDIQSYYDFWEIPDEAKKDTFQMLAYTQGILPTDNFEFLAEYGDAEGVHFVSEIAGLTKAQLENDALKDGDELEWQCEPNNEYDQNAVMLLKGGNMLGYVKRVHSHVFYLPNSRLLKVKVKKMEHNGHISRVFIVIYDSKSL